jgi:hypothetical protein
MNLQDLTNQENCVESPSEPIENDTLEQEIIDDKPQCKYVSTIGKFVGKLCNATLALELYYEIGLCKKHQTIVNMREKSAQRKSKKQSKDKGIVVQSPALKELRTIYLDNISVGPEAKLLFLAAISAVGYHNSNIEYDNSQSKPSYSE